jgi:hypothetical protein
MTAPPVGVPALPSGPVPPQPALPVAVDNCMLPLLMGGDGRAVPVGATFTCKHGYIWRVQWQQAWGGETQPAWVASTPPQ